MKLSSEPRLFHGGVPGLRIGDLIEPGNDRRHHDGCPWCEARARGEVGPGSIDPLAAHVDQVYVTTEREYARFYSSLYGYGDLYRVEPIGELIPSDEDNWPAWRCPAARVVGIVARAVLLTPQQRRRINERWGQFDTATAQARMQTREAQQFLEHHSITMTAAVGQHVWEDQPDADELWHTLPPLPRIDALLAAACDGDRADTALRAGFTIGGVR